MKRCICLVVVAACSKSADTPPSATGSSASGSAAATSGGGGGRGGSSSLANKVAKLADACPLLPQATVARLVPNGGKPQGQRYPLQCSVYGMPSALEITFDTGPAPASHDTDVGESSSLERLNPKDKGDVYLTISLGTDDNGNNRNLHVEVSGHDGKEHKDDAIGLAREVLANLAK